MKGKIAGLIVLAVSFIILGIITVRWINYRLNHAITNAVFVESESFVRVAYKRVGGRIEELYKEEGDRVYKGEALARIDDRDIRIKIEELDENIKALEMEREALRIEYNGAREEIKKGIEKLEEEMESLKAKRGSLEALIEQLKKDRRRLKELYERGVVPLKEFERVDTELKVRLKELKSLNEKLESLEKEREILKFKLFRTESLKKKIEALENKINALKKKKEDLENLLEETVLRSPISGYVAKKYVNVGEVVRQGQYIYALYNPEDIYILVLLEETKLRGVKEGNRVYIKIDAYPDIEFEGVVKEIGVAAASKFAIIPRDITAGEFTKVAQRIPVKVEIVKGPKELLKVGMSGEVAIEKSD